MSEITRRVLLTGAAAAPLLAQQTAPTVAHRRRRATPFPNGTCSARRFTAESLQKSLVDRATWKPFPAAADRGAVERASGGSKDTVRQAAETLPRQTLRAASRHALPRVRAQRQPLPLGGRAVRAPHPPARHRARRVRGRQGPLPRRYRRRRLGDLRGDFLGRPRAHGRAETRRRSARCAGAHHRALLR